MVLLTPGAAGAQQARRVSFRRTRIGGLPAGPGRDDTFYSCTACHGFS